MLPLCQCATGAKHRPQQTIFHRRLLRLHRACSECARHHDLEAALLPQLLFRINRCFSDYGAPPLLQNCSFRLAFHDLNESIQRQETLQAREKAKAWNAHFRSFTSKIWGPAKQKLRPPAPQPAFDANQMRQDWEKHWCPTVVAPNEHIVENWFSFAGPAQKLPGHKPGLPHFTSALLRSSGAAGFDGWTYTEAKILQTYLTPLADELFQLWIETTLACEQGTLPQEARDQIWAWKVLGFPKKTAEDSRPISVASTLVRAWHKCLLNQCGQPPPGQWCGKPGSSVTTAAANFFESNPIDFAETDLTKAFDHLSPVLAQHALNHFGAHNAITATLAQAWSACRVCTVHVIAAAGECRKVIPARHWH